VSLQAKVKEQEKVIRGALGKQLSLVQEESKKLSKIQEALETLEKKQQKDIDILRNRKPVLVQQSLKLTVVS